LKEEVEPRKSNGEAMDANFFASRVADLEAEASRQEKDVFATYVMLMRDSEGADPRIAPLRLRRALAVWGLTADDIGVLSTHGTSTQANEKDETYMWNTILKTLVRTAGNAAPIMAQKSLVSHAKGGAAAWQMACLLQSIASGIVPGNCNADSVDALSRSTHC
jgi:fatty acid synthase subunit alpha, fungi type